MKVKALKPFTMRNSSTGELTSVACGSVITVTDAQGGQLITDGLAEAYTLVNPTGTKTITENGTNIDVSEYAKADVNVPSTEHRFSISFGGLEDSWTCYFAYDSNMSFGDFVNSGMNPVINGGGAKMFGSDDGSLIYTDVNGSYYIKDFNGPDTPVSVEDDISGSAEYYCDLTTPN